jgi:short-subunit dehydrogenase
LAGYRATEEGVRLFAKAVAMECAAADDNIRVNTVHPGVIHTPSGRRRSAAALPDTLDDDDFLGLVAAMVEDMPKGSADSVRGLVANLGAIAIILGRRHDDRQYLALQHMLASLWAAQDQIAWML